MLPFQVEKLCKANPVLKRIALLNKISLPEADNLWKRVVCLISIGLVR